MSVIALAAWLAAASTPAADVASPRTGPVAAVIHSETFKRTFNNTRQPFRVDYTASLTWALSERKVCVLHRCRTVCDMTISHKVLSRRLWWAPPAMPPVLAGDTLAQREYAGGTITFGQVCSEVRDRDVARGAAESLRPYQFADELMKDQPLLMKSADDYLAINPPAP
jgi:hypothetical protein